MIAHKVMTLCISFNGMQFNSLSVSSQYFESKCFRSTPTG